MKRKILIIGDTVINKTYHVQTQRPYRSPYPHSYLNEEHLYLNNPPLITIQGASYIAEYLVDAGFDVTLWTSTGITYEGNTHERDVLVNHLQNKCSEKSIFDIDNRPTNIVTRILRNVSYSQLNSTDPEYRPQLRIDVDLNKEYKLHIPYEKISSIIGEGDICLFRILNTEFLGRGEDVILETINKVQHHVKNCGAKLIIDVRPLPPNLKILSNNTIICTTIGRLLDHRNVFSDEHASPNRDISQIKISEIIEEKFWEMHPLSGLICFANKADTFAIHKDLSDHEALLHTVKLEWSAKSKDSCGSITAGDAWIAGITSHLSEEDSSILNATKYGNTAYMKAYCKNLGAKINPEEINIENENSSDVSKLSNPHLNRLGKILDSLGVEFRNINDLKFPPDGSLNQAINTLISDLQLWKPDPGSDLIAIFGESRSGKEFILKKVLKHLGYEYVGPVNMQQFLSETRGCLNELERNSNLGKKKILIIDEVTPGDLARSLLNLMAEKKFISYLTNEHVIDFTLHPIILLSSIHPDQMLEDLRGRLYNRNGVTIPPLRERWDEIPFHMYNILTSKFPNSTIKISYAYLYAFIQHDFCPTNIHMDDIIQTGLDQRNFRALNDLVKWTLKSLGEAETKTLTKNNLPNGIAKNIPESIQDDTYLTSTNGSYWKK